MGKQPLDTDIEREISDIRRQVETLEERGASSAGFAKEIDHILARLTKVEEKVGIHKR